MKKFKRFGEFLENKKELIDAKKGLAGEDYSGPLETKPPQEPSKGKKDKPLPYKNGGEEKKAIAWTAPDTDVKKGLAHQATPGITPETSPLGEPVKDTTKPRPKPKKMTTEEFIKHTKDMKNSEFMNYILEAHSTEISTVTDLFGNEFTPDPQQSIEYVAGLMLGNPYFMEKFIREVKRRDGFENLVQEVLQHGDSYDLIIDHLEEPELGQSRAGKMVRMMNERYMKHFDGFGGLEEQVSPSLDQGNLMALPEKPKFEKPEQDMSTPEQPEDPRANPNFGEEDVVPPMSPKQMKSDEQVWRGPHAAGHLINEFGNYKGFMRHMSDICKNGKC